MVNRKQRRHRQRELSGLFSLGKDVTGAPPNGYGENGSGHPNVRTQQSDVTGYMSDVMREFGDTHLRQTKSMPFTVREPTNTIRSPNAGLRLAQRLWRWSIPTQHGAICLLIFVKMFPQCSKSHWCYGVQKMFLSGILISMYVYSELMP